MTERYYRHILSVLPKCDMEDYPAELFRSFADHGAKLRRDWPWCAELPEELFLDWVLCPRVNNEELSDCRGMFYEQLEPRVRGLSLPEAILEVNRWCGEHVTYRSTDIRTASALAVYESGFGRCGEESVFAVNALRSVGIAARQVYAPWWSHCDDNHAWVEAFDGESWRFLGACEPEPRLDMGWFIPAAGRAMLCHAKRFTESGLEYVNVTGRYAKTREFTVTVTDQKGGGIEGAIVEYYVLNMGLLRKIARKVTDSHGRAVISLGLGSVWVTARQGDMLGEAFINTAETDNAKLRLPGGNLMSGDYDFLPPADSGIRAGGLTEDERLQRQRDLRRARELREGLHPPGGPGPRKPELWPWERFPQGETPELWDDGEVHGLRSPECGSLTLRRGEGKGAVGLMRLEDGWRALKAPGYGAETALPAGTYRLITSYRLPGGAQLAKVTDFIMTAGASVELTADFRRAGPEMLLQRLPLPELGFRWEGAALLCWIDPGAEPTEHLINELADFSECPVHFICRATQEFNLPEGASLHPWDDYAAETAARRVFLEPGNLPLVVLADGEGFARFASAGYNVGSVELCAELCGVIAGEKRREKE